MPNPCSSLWQKFPNLFLLPLGPFLPKLCNSFGKLRDPRTPDLSFNSGADLPQEVQGEESETVRSASPLSIDEVLSKSAVELRQPLPPSCTGLVYDEKMTEHYNMWDR